MAEGADVWAFGPRASLAAGFLNPPEPEPLQPRDPERVGRYTLVGRLGSGGMGVAYLARDDDGREVALKLVHPGLADHEEFRARFVREVAAARRVPGRYTARVLDADVQDDPPWLATEYFRCWTLAQQVSRFGPLGAENAAILIARLAEALAAMHTLALVHRDLKPSNILLAPDGPRVIDFGVARAADLAALTTTGRPPGTPGYMAPEQIEGNSAGPPADVFALGACLVYATTARSPFWDGSPTTLMYRTVYAEPDLGTMPDALRLVALRCLAKDARQRPSAAELVAEFGSAGAATERIVVDADSPSTDSRHIVEIPPPRRRRKSAIAVAAAVAGLLVAASVVLALTTSGGRTASPVHTANAGHPTHTTASPAATSTSTSTSTATSPAAPIPSRPAAAIPGNPPPLPHGLVGYTGRLVGENLAWFQNLHLSASSEPWSSGGLWSAIAGPGCRGGVGHSLSAPAAWSSDPAHGGTTFGGCDGEDLVTRTVPPGKAATTHIAWNFSPGPAVSDCALFAYNATSPANLAFGDYAVASRGGQFPMSGASHAGEWVELGTAAPDSAGRLRVSLGDDQSTDAQHPAGPTVTAAQVVAVCGGPAA